jgi:beta-phosphoglucomutase
VNKPVAFKLDCLKAVIFDMDGTMIDNGYYHRKAWSEFIKKHDLSKVDITDHEFKQHFSGRKNDSILELLFNRKLTEEELDKHGEDKETLYRKLYAPHIKEVKGLTAIVNRLKKSGIKVAIATTSPKKNREFVLEKLSLTKAFPVIVGSEHVLHGKPDPEIYIKTAKKLKVDSKECLVFEDTPVGIEAAKNAGMRVIGILTRHSEEELRAADLATNDFTKIIFE